MIRGIHKVWKPLLLFGGGLLALIILLFISLTQGEADISVSTVIDSLLRPEPILEHQLITGLRLPRAVIAILGGASLAVAGALLQTVTRNPLASASTLGLNAGAYFVVVFTTVFFPVVKSEAPLLLALIGACGAAIASYMLAGGRKSTPVRMALAGMIVSLVLASFTSALQLLYENETSGLFVWGAGSLVQNDWSGVLYAWPWVAIGLIVALLLARMLDLLELGEESARSLGQRVSVTRFSALSAAVLLAGVTVSVVGPIGFVGLIAPHLIKLLGFRRHSLLIPASALYGAVVLVGADTIARMFISSLGELPAGAVTALIGAPWLIWLAVRGAKGQPSAEAGTSMSIGMTRSRLSFPVLVAGGILAVVALFLFGLSAGTMKMPVSDVVTTLFGGGSDMTRSIVLELRMPRLLVAALAGASLAIAGVMLQGAVRNPLADPSVIGVTSGAGFGALLLLVVWPNASGDWLPLAAILGAVAAAVSVYALSWRKGLNPMILALVGIAVSAIGSAGIQFLVIKSGIGVAPALAWLAGSTYARGWEEFIRIAIAAVILFPLAWILGRRVDLLAFGDQVSQGLGLKLMRTRLITAASGVALAAVAVSCVGTVGFIGLLAPHAVRMLVGQNHRRSVVLSAIAGALLLLLADIVGKLVIAPKEVPAGIIAALIGTPYLLYIMYRGAVKRS